MAWQPSHDFVFFRKTSITRETRGGIVLPGEENMFTFKALAAGPGRALPNGATRVPPCKPGDYILVNTSNPVVTEFLDDDGEMTYIVGSEYIIATRSDAPPATAPKARVTL